MTKISVPRRKIPVKTEVFLYNYNPWIGGHKLLHYNTSDKGNEERCSSDNQLFNYVDLKLRSLVALFFLLLLYFRQMIDTDGSTSRHTSFDVIRVLGGGMFETESDAEGLSISCNELIINSGGRFQAYRLDLQAKTAKIDQSGILDANFKVLNTFLLSCIIIYHLKSSPEFVYIVKPIAFDFKLRYNLYRTSKTENIY